MLCYTEMCRDLVLTGCGPESGLSRARCVLRPRLVPEKKAGRQVQLGLTMAECGRDLPLFPKSNILSQGGFPSTRSAFVLDSSPHILTFRLCAVPPHTRSTYLTHSHGNVDLL